MPCYLKTKTLQNRKPRKLFNEWIWNNWKNSQYNSKCIRKSCENATLTWSKMTLSITKTPEIPQFLNQLHYGLTTLYCIKAEQSFLAVFFLEL